MRRLFVALLLAGSALVATSARADDAPTKLLRFPDVSGDQVVFSYGGDLWKASTSGGLATRLTAHPGVELFAKFSPDGKWIAFTGQYDGDEQVYVIPAEGGEPRQLTYYPAHGPLAPRWGYDNQVYGWTPDGKKVLFRSIRDEDFGRTLTALYTVSVDGGLPTELPMPTSGAGDFSPDGSRIVYSPLWRDFRSWKRYQGGWAQDLYIFDLASHALTPIAHSPRTERDPMWIGDSIYFISDRDGTLNLYRSDLTGRKVEELTHSKTWDYKWASSDSKHQIVYEADGQIELYDTDTNTATRLAIHVPDDGINRRPGRVSAADQIEDFELAPHGERALFSARGDIFTAPIEKGPTRNLTDSSNAHDKFGRWSPDGRRIAFVSDRTGEDQIWVVDQDGSKPAEQLTTTFQGMLYAPAWSPDGKRIAFSDKNGKVYVLGVADKKVTEIADDEYGLVNDYAWSPDSSWLAYSLGGENNNRSLWIWSAADGKARRVSDGTFDEESPSWDPDGKYLYYLSQHEFAPQISLVEWNFAGNRMTGIFVLALRKDVANPYPAQSDEVKIEDKAKEPASGDAKKGDEAAKPVAIDFDGLAGRTAAVPVEAENIGAVVAVPGGLLYSTFGAPFYGRESYEKGQLHYFDADKRDASVLVDGARGWAVSADGKKVLVSEGKAYKLYDVGPKAGEAKAVSTAGLEVDRVPTQEWAEIFNEVWRRYRDFFYVRNMHGYDWKAIGDRYRTLLPDVTSRSDLNYVLSEMVAELNIGHAYIVGGDWQSPERPVDALPGARFELDPAAGRYRIATIFRGDNQEEKYRAPLEEIGVDARVGDYVLAIDGVDLAGTDNPYRLLRHKTDPVTLTLNSKPTREGARQVTYRPITDESNLLYKAWVDHNRAWVAEHSGGRVGYIHIPDMGADGAYEFIKWFYPQIRKEGMIVDIRSNGGGNISQWILERLDTKLLGTRFDTFSDHPSTYPSTVFYGHLVCLLDETSASDGDIFPYYFRKAGLGPLIGKRSWGGVVGITDTGPLLDGGTVYVPLDGTNGPDGQWVIEGHGVDPDIEVANDPADVIAGRDPQLERGLAEVMKAMEKEPMKLPSRPPDPVKTQ